MATPTATPARQPVAFDHLNPKPQQHDPTGIGASMREYPRHLHKYAGPGQINDYIVVNNDAQRNAAIADGWSLTPQGPPPVKEETEKPRGKAKGEASA